MRGPLAKDRNCWRASDGHAAMEFIIVLPLLLALYLGVQEAVGAVSANRKIAEIVATTADLLGRKIAVDTAALDGISAIAMSSMAPYPAKSLTLFMYGITFDGLKNARLCWSSAFEVISDRPVQFTKIPAPALDFENDVQSALRIKDSSLIVVKSSYQYASPFDFILKGTFRLSQTAYSTPRATVQCPQS
jgi:Flp pilus assembly protein TadG